MRCDVDFYLVMFGEFFLFYIFWIWKDLGCYIGGLVMYVLLEMYYLVVGRDWDGEVLMMKIWLLEKGLV